MAYTFQVHIAVIASRSEAIQPLIGRRINNKTTVVSGLL